MDGKETRWRVGESQQGRRVWMSQKVRGRYLILWIADYIEGVGRVDVGRMGGWNRNVIQPLESK